MTFKACSEPEVTGWLLSFGDQEKLIEPDWLVRRLRGGYFCGSIMTFREVSASATKRKPSWV